MYEYGAWVNVPTCEISVAAPPRSLPRSTTYPSLSLSRMVVMATPVLRKTLFSTSICAPIRECTAVEAPTT